MLSFRRLWQSVTSEKYKLRNTGGRDHATIISLKKRNDGHMYGMTVDFTTNTFCVSRSSAVGDSKREYTAYLIYSLLTKAGKALVKRYDDGNLEDGDLEEFDRLLVEVMDTYLFGVQAPKIEVHR